MDRNKAIDLWKLVAAIFIVLMHSFNFFREPVVLRHGVVVCEFFFIVSGYFFAASVFRDDRAFCGQTIGWETLQFVYRKIRRFWLYFVFGFALAFLAKLVQCDWDEPLLRLTNAIPELFLLRSTGMPVGKSSGIMASDWYLSSMVIALFLLYPLFRRNRDFFADWLAVVLGIGGLSLMFILFGKVSPGVAKHAAWLNVRAIGGICLGVVSYRLSMRLRSADLSRRAKTLLSLVGQMAAVLGFVTVALMADVSQMVFVIFCFFLFMTLSPVGDSWIRSPGLDRAARHLGDLSMALYLTHTAVRWTMLYWSTRSQALADLFQEDTPEAVWKVLAIYMVAALALAEICVLVCKPLARRTGK